MGRTVSNLPDNRLAFVCKSVEDSLFDAVKLKRLHVDPLDQGLVRSTALQANLYGKRTRMRDGRWLQINVPFSGTGAMAPAADVRRHPGPSWTSPAVQDLPTNDLRADDWQESPKSLDPLFEQARAVRPCRQSYIDEHNAALTDSCRVMSRSRELASSRGCGPTLADALGQVDVFELDAVHSQIAI
ncbi:hypothetical protein [Sphingomonas jatrophae]|uniref:hypothetical protein n=1 Tax=Sphingomonas jatrophae TaxID=1166337 RepID=UPI001041CE02|nr:hypothetical protein [Sphingomonas jatrophae]